MITITINYFCFCISFCVVIEFKAILFCFQFPLSVSQMLQTTLSLPRRTWIWKFPVRGQDLTPLTTLLLCCIAVGSNSCMSYCWPPSSSLSECISLSPKPDSTKFNSSPKTLHSSSSLLQYSFVNVYTTCPFCQTELSSSTGTTSGICCPW